MVASVRHIVLHITSAAYNGRSMGVFHGVFHIGLEQLFYENRTVVP